MIRGSTPTHTFEIPVNASLLDEAMIIYAQNDIEVFHKDIDDITKAENTISVTLTQEETLMLSHLSPVQIQLKLLTNDGAVLVSDEIVISIKKCLNDEVL